MTTKQIRTAITNKYAAIPERQISTGVYIHTVGYKYVTVLNSWDTTRLSRVTIEDFYSEHI